MATKAMGRGERAMISAARHQDCPYLSWRGAGFALVAAILLCWPMLLTTAPLVYFDTVSYFSNGEQLWLRVLALVMPPAPVAPGAAADAMEAGIQHASAAGLSFRSLPYSTLFYPLVMTPLGLVAACILQTTVVLWAFFGLVPRLTAQSRNAALAGFAAVGTLTTLPWFASYAMPDILGAVLPSYYALALRRADGLSWGKQVALMLVAAFAMLSHYGHLPLALGLALGVLLWRTWRGRLNWFAAGFCMLPLLAALMVNFSASLVVSMVSGGAAPVVASAEVAGETEAGREAGGADTLPGASVTPNRLPVMLARSLEDGPARVYLEETCATGDVYAMCEAFDEIPRNIHQLLWAETGLKSLPPELVERIRLEETTVVLAAARAHPLLQAQAFAGNILGQLASTGTGEVLLIPEGASAATLESMPPSTELSEADPVLSFFDKLTWIVTALAAVVLLWRIATGRSREEVVEAALMTFFALLVNAVIYGGLSAPVDRYQSRMVWLVPAVLALDFVLRRPAAATSEEQPTPLA